MSPFGVLVILAGMVVHHGDGRPAIAEMNADQKRAAAQGYLGNYGYLGEKYMNSYTAELVAISDEQFGNAVREFQIMFGMQNMTGILDAETVRMMDMPRCGVGDKVTKGDSSKRRRKRYVLEGSKWQTNNLRYKIINFSPDMSQSDAASEIARAFKVWSDVTPLTFRRVYGNENAHINIQFRAREHGDGYPFDGRGGTLAHAFFPRYNGDSHFDEDERWTLRTNSGTNLFQVAAHEFGHALGLLHSQMTQALMYAFYRGYQPNFRLDTDDVQGIRAIYGSSTPPVTQRPRVPTTRRPAVVTNRRPATVATTRSPGDRPQLCSLKTIDSIAVINNHTYVFQGALVYKLRLNVYGIMPGYPRLISREFPGVPDNLDAVIHWPRATVHGKLQPARTYFFKGDRYWRFGNNTTEYDRAISNGFRGLPNNIDAAFVWSGNQYTYFIKGDQYYKYYRGSGVGGGYPKPVEYWKGLPNRIDGAVQWRNRRTYFFSGGNYYRFNDFTFQIDRGYPKLSENIWFGCHRVGNSVDLETMDDGGIQFVEVGVNSAMRGYTSSYVVILAVLLVSVLTRAFT